MNRIPPMPELREPTLRATYRGYYTPGVGRLLVCFFGGWVGTSWNNAEEAHRNMAAPADMGAVHSYIDIGTHEVWS